MDLISSAAESFCYDWPDEIRDDLLSLADNDAGDSFLLENISPSIEPLLNIQSKIEEPAALNNKKKKLNNVKPKPLWCIDLQPSYIRKPLMEKSKKGSEKEKKFECTVCNKKFSQKGHLNVHSSNVHGNQKNLCHICGKQFKHKNSIPLHAKKEHPEAEPLPPQTHSCNICDKKFSRPADLKRHETIHFPVKYFQCTEEDCKVTSRWVFVIRKHIRQEHCPPRKLFECENCHKSFPYEHLRTKHLSKCPIPVLVTK